ncbi:MAG: acyl-CoA desaturase [Deltaproteobacteria bacterium]|nr:acyl-CoA desaturase [Deltaproteobacteria bacterium]
MPQIIIFFVAHWVLSIFCQTFFLHRYGAHSMFTMSRRWERFFHLMTFVCQGSSYLNPRSYAYLHREHHAFSETERDPHSPHIYKNLFTLMLVTKKRYDDFNHGRALPEARFQNPAPPDWPLIDKLGRSGLAHIAFGSLYTVFYLVYAPHWAFYLLLPVHYLIGPIHGAIVNWCGHKYGYRNFETTQTDKSRNTLFFDFLTGGELFQNNHHKYVMSPNFAARWFEIDPTYPVIKLLAWLKIIDLGPSPQIARYPAPAAG